MSEKEPASPQKGYFTTENPSHSGYLLNTVSHKEDDSTVKIYTSGWL